MVNFQNKRIVRGLALAGVAGAMAACGGGGGGGGSGGIPGGPTTANEYVVSLRADHAALPLNIGREGPGIGVNAPYTTTLYVFAKRKNTGDVIPGGQDVFGCNVLPVGLEYGSLYYLDGDPDHETEVDQPDGTKIRVPNAYRSITLDSNSGGASFHFHAGATAGTAEVICSVTDPQSGKQESAAVKISVGERTGVASQVRVNAASNSLGYLFAQNIGGETQLLLQAQVLDDTGQRAPNPPSGVNNLYARIVPTASSADDDARLRGTGQADNTWIKTRSINGQAQFSVISGVNVGPVLIEVVADRADNNIDNGIQQAISNYYRVDVVDGSVFLVPPAIVKGEPLEAGKQGEPYEPVILQVTGGTPPYTWSLAQGSLPPGMSLRSYGVIDGTPLSVGSFSFLARVTDANGLSAEEAYGLLVEPGSLTALTIQTTTLVNGTENTPYEADVIVAAPTGVTPAVTVGPLPSGLSYANGKITGTPAGGTAGDYDVVIRASATIGVDQVVVERTVKLTIQP